MARKSRNKIAFVFLLLLFLSLACVLCVSAVSILLSEVVSKESNRGSVEPVFEIDSKGTIHAVWVDETDLGTGFTSTNSSLAKLNGPDRDIFYNYRENGSWSSLAFSEGRMIGGVDVLSNSSITTSIQPDIAIDMNDTVHVVWSALVPPSPYIANENTTFIAHFDSENSLISADYAKGNASVIEASIGLNDLTQNALNGKAIALNKKQAYISFYASENINSLRGTIEFWFNPLWDEKKSYDAKKNYHLFQLFKSNGDLYISLKHTSFPQLSVDSTEFFFDYDNERKIYNIPKSKTSILYPIERNEWHHFAFTYDFSISEVKIYLDGYLLYSNYSAPNLSNIPNLQNSTFCIGNCIRFGKDDTADIIIDEFIISKNVKSEEEIKADAGRRSIFYINITNKTEKSNQEEITYGFNWSYFPRIAVDSSNNLHVVWNEMRNKTSSKIMYKFRNSSTGNWSNSEIVSEGALAYMPDMCV
ncbi:MAG: LamG domain-containing protein, partial [Candidatus Woesearchaeota archaeon]|nr:LamG domain-containing protein [Candidatus Woesearchaeota archaeon]